MQVRLNDLSIQVGLAIDSCDRFVRQLSSVITQLAINPTVDTPGSKSDFGDVVQKILGSLADINHELKELGKTIRSSS
jgi:hypothetical protein